MSSIQQITGQSTSNKAVTITSEGAVAGILASSGVGITISAGANDVINLRGLDIDGGNTGSVGIQFNSGQSLNIQKSSIRNFTGSGINFAPSGASTLFVIDTTLINNVSNGISLAKQCDRRTQPRQCHQQWRRYSRLRQRC